MSAIQLVMRGHDVFADRRLAVEHFANELLNVGLVALTLAVIERSGFVENLVDQREFGDGGAAGGFDLGLSHGYAPW
jgi:hypothetical protein